MLLPQFPSPGGSPRNSAQVFTAQVDVGVRLGALHALHLILISIEPVRAGPSPSMHMTQPVLVARMFRETWWWGFRGHWTVMGFELVTNLEDMVGS
ncbi:hypothetical protein PGTUg99_014160 [Puccinia graminis f. sp. tritici]|uniref:Uncharacterized protein n=1 Tax=Puccinia graminis f. sp. tritici TaxID=56615 RepID=A0A5B0N9T3_PUCGR|nr:hypothetical protein PGTUg99_014160 [Puccinia graminis f. sp. tritici]